MKIVQHAIYRIYYNQLIIVFYMNMVNFLLSDK